MLKYVMLVLLLTTSRFASAEAVHHCSAEAVIQAKKTTGFSLRFR